MIINNIIIFFIFIVALIFIYIQREKDRKNQIRIFQEFVKAEKAQDIHEYAQVIPEENEEVVIDEGDELIDLNQVPADQLLTKLKEMQEYEDN